MTYGKLKVLVSGLLIGDNKISKDDEELKALLLLAFNDIASRAESLHLMTLNQNKEIKRFSTGDYLTRYPKEPDDENSALDIDEDLCFVASRLIASYISKNKPQVHKAEAENMILVYNSKVNSILEKMHVDENGDYYVRN